jgi:cell division protein FtsB
MIRRLQRFDLLVAMGCLVLLSYFGWHAWKGPRGYSYLAALEVKADALAQDLTGDEAKRGQLEAKVALMRPERVDPDMLEELARSQLELSRRNELVVRLQN